jgi:hypothetical protein
MKNELTSNLPRVAVIADASLDYVIGGANRNQSGYVIHPGQAWGKNYDPVAHEKALARAGRIIEEQNGGGYR